MLEAIVRHSKLMGDRELEVLEANLASAIAEAFDCDDEGGRLAAQDIDVHYVVNDGRDSVKYPIIISVGVFWFPSLSDSFGLRCRQLHRTLKRLMGNTKFALRPSLIEAKWLTSDDNVD